MIDVSRIAGSLRIAIGAGLYDRPGWILTQQEDLDLLRREDWEASFGDRRLAAILAEHVWEHLTSVEGRQAARLCHDFLAPGGYVRCAVPDGLFPDAAYQSLARVGGPGPADHPAAGHKVLYTYRTLRDVFESAGFTAHLLEYWDELGCFHFSGWDPADGFIYRSRRFDQRNRHGRLGFTSLILDAVKEVQTHR